MHFFSGRFRLVLYFFLAFVSTAFLIRICLFGFSFSNFELPTLLPAFFIGLFYDLIAANYFLLFFVFYLVLMPNRIFNHKFHQSFIAISSFALSFYLLFNGVSEFFFWEEFNARFNFIAVDYLVYTHEVLSNIHESYPVVAIVSFLLGLNLLFFVFAYKKNLHHNIFVREKFSLRLLKASPLFSFALLSFIFLDNSLSTYSKNRYNNELAKNGTYSLFAAFRNNELDFYKFYKTQDELHVFANLRQLLKEPHAHFINKNPFDITRFIKNEGDEKRYNVMQITVESLSASFMQRFGSTRNLTPKLDALSKKAMFFTNFYATGTRTVRGMESLTLSIPPTPGRSIVKRPNNANMFSAGQIFRSKGYDVKFIYGGDGYFDNMNTFFGNNGFDIVDRGRRFLVGDNFQAKRTNINDAEVQFENAWGVSDEDLFAKALSEADNSFKNKKPFYSFIMTTSNHRPYTYPANKIDVPSGEGRHGAVKYTDFAIAQFLEQAKTKPWFDNTLFVIVSDHCASSAGKRAIDINKYKIPLMIYAPKIVLAQEVDALMSQIDYLPTLLGLLNWSYTSKFFGKDIFKTPKEQQRVLLGNYQKLALLKDETLTILSPQQGIEAFNVRSEQQKQPNFDALTYYQGAAYLYKHGLNRYE